LGSLFDANLLQMQNSNKYHYLFPSVHQPGTIQESAKSSHPCLWRRWNGKDAMHVGMNRHVQTARS